MNFMEWWMSRPPLDRNPNGVVAEVDVKEECEAAWNAALESARPAPSMKQWNSRSLSRRVGTMDKMIRAAKKEKP